MKWWKIDEGKQVEGTELDYYIYKLDRLIKNKECYNEDYFYKTCYEYFERIIVLNAIREVLGDESLR